MEQGNKKNKTGTPSAIFFIVLLVPLSFINCSRNNPLDPKAGNYDAGTNILQDPGFETGGAPWQGHLSGGRSIVNSGALSGTFCEQIVLSPYPRTVWQDLTVSAGKVYSVSGWIKTDTVTTSAHILVFWYNTATPPGNQMPPLPTDHRFIKTDTLGSLTGTNAYTKLSRNYYAPDSALSAQVYLECGPPSDTSTGTAWFDNLTFNSH